MKSFRRCRTLQIHKLLGWVVYSTARREGWLMLYNYKTNQTGTVRNPSRQEWRRAFYSPDNNYRWFDASRVVIDPKKTNTPQPFEDLPF